MEAETLLYTPRLVLKGITPSIINQLFNAGSKEDIMQYFGIDEKGYAHYRMMYEKGMETFRLSMFYFLLITRDNNLPIGECGFHTWNISHRRAELFYSLRHDEDKQKGYMTEALREVLNYGFSELKLHRIEALVAESNIPSIRLLKRFGFTKEGTMREDYVVNGVSEDSDCYSLLKWEWM